MGAAATPQTITLSFMDHRLGLCPWDTSLLGRGPRSSRPPCHEVLPADTSPHSKEDGPLAMGTLPVFLSVTIWLRQTEDKSGLHSQLLLVIWAKPPRLDNSQGCIQSFLSLPILNIPERL